MPSRSAGSSNGCCSSCDTLRGRSLYGCTADDALYHLRYSCAFPGTAKTIAGAGTDCRRLALRGSPMIVVPGPYRLSDFASWLAGSRPDAVAGATCRAATRGARPRLTRLAFIPALALTAGQRFDMPAAGSATNRYAGASPKRSQGQGAPCVLRHAGAASGLSAAASTRRAFRRSKSMYSAGVTVSTSKVELASPPMSA